MVSRSCGAGALLLALLLATAAQQAAAFAISQTSHLMKAAARPLTAAPKTTAANAAASSSSSSSGHSLEGEPIEGPLQPLRGMVLLQKLEQETKTKGGLLLPTDSRKEQLIGRVLATGPGEMNPDTGKRVGFDVNPGDLVIFSKHSGEGLKYDGSDCVLLTGDDLLAKIENPQNLDPKRVQPLGDTVFVRILKQPEKSAGGLLLTQQQHNRLMHQAVVVAAGPGRLNKQQARIAPEVSVGNRVIYSSYAEDASQLKVGDEVYAFVRAGDLAAKW